MIVINLKINVGINQQKKKKNMKKLLWLDDFRDPFKDDWLNFSAIPPPFDVIWVKTYDEFVHWIETNGLPDGICFDHDLADEHYHSDMYVSTEAYNKHYDGFKEKTGYEAAKWLIDYCIDNDKELPKFNVHSANPIGKANIRGLLTNFMVKYPEIKNYDIELTQEQINDLYGSSGNIRKKKQ